MDEEARKDYEFVITGTLLKPLHRQVDEHLCMEKAETTGKGKIGKAAWKVDKVLLNRKEERWESEGSCLLLRLQQQREPAEIESRRNKTK